MLKYSFLLKLGKKNISCRPWNTLLDVCYHACEVACSNFLMYSTEICASAVQIHPEGKDLPSQTTTPRLEEIQRKEGQSVIEKTRQTTGVCSVEVNRSRRELPAALCINNSWYFLLGSGEKRDCDREDVSTCE